MLFKQRLIFAYVNGPILNLHDKFVKDIIDDNAIPAFVCVHVKILPKQVSQIFSHTLYFSLYALCYSIKYKKAYAKE